MTNVFDLTITNAANIILKTSDRELSSDGYNIKVFDSSKISIPKLHLDKTKVEIKQEQISYRNAPPGISFSMSSSRTIEYAIYTIPVSGDMELFAYLVRPYVDRRTIYLEYKNICYKEYSNVQISGNDDLINQIKNRVIGFTTNINANLKQFEDEVNTFHQIKLKPIIDELIKTEIAKRNLTSDSVSKLNPFI